MHFCLNHNFLFRTSPSGHKWTVPCVSKIQKVPFVRRDIVQVPIVRLSHLYRSLRSSKLQIVTTDAENIYRSDIEPKNDLGDMDNMINKTVSY